MAKKLHLVHVKSSVADKAPSASTLDYGEIAVNYNSETPALYIRDDEDNIVKFIAEPYFNKIVGTGITENDGETITPLTEVIEQDELTVSAAFNDINNRLSDLSGVTAEILSDLDEKASTDYVDEAIEEALTGVTIDVDDHLDSASTNPVENRVLTRIINENEMVTAAAINYLNDNKVGISEFDDLADDLDELASGIAMNYYTKGETPITGTTQTGSGNVVTSVTINDKVLNIALGEISGGDEAVSAVTINGTGNSVTDVSFIDKSLTLTKGNVQETLVSGTNIKTFAGQDLLGSGDVVRKRTMEIVSESQPRCVLFYGQTKSYTALVSIPSASFSVLVCASGPTGVAYDYSDCVDAWGPAEDGRFMMLRFKTGSNLSIGNHDVFVTFLNGNFGDDTVNIATGGIPSLTTPLTVVNYYQKPSSGIPATDLAQAVRTSLGKADTALQSADLTFIKGTGTGSAVLKDGGATATGQFAVAEGAAYSNTPTAAAGDASHAEGAATNTKAQAAHSEGLQTIAGRTLAEAQAALSVLDVAGTTEQKVSKLIGFASHSEGSSTQALGTSSHAEGNSTQALVNATHAEGDTTTASGEAAHSEGYKTTASGNQSHSEGFNTQATANQAHSEGKKTIASAENAHSEGNETKAVGNASHSEGYRTYAYGAMSHIEGTSSTLVSDANAASESVESIWEENGHNFSLSRGQGSHVEGKNCLATGDWSHAEGNTTNAVGDSSHAEGSGTEANNASEHAEGRYNKSNKASTTFGNSGNTIHSVGIGASSGARTNAFEIMQNGDIYVKGLGSYNGTNPAAAQTLKQVIDAKGTYSKPSGGIPATDLASAVQTSLGKADSALQGIILDWTAQNKISLTDLATAYQAANKKLPVFVDGAGMRTWLSQHGYYTSDSRSFWVTSITDNEDGAYVVGCVGMEDDWGTTDNTIFLSFHCDQEDDGAISDIKTSDTEYSGKVFNLDWQDSNGEPARGIYPDDIDEIISAMRVNDSSIVRISGAGLTEYLEDHGYSNVSVQYALVTSITSNNGYTICFSFMVNGNLAYGTLVLNSRGTHVSDQFNLAYTKPSTGIPASDLASGVGLPAVTSTDNGKILQVVNGQWALVVPSTIYSGNSAPASSLGVDGDIYLQTS